MSAYDTVLHLDEVTVRFYCEAPMDEAYAVMLAVDQVERGATTYLTPDAAIRVATALLKAAEEAKHRLVVDSVVGGKRR